MWEMELLGIAFELELRYGQVEEEEAGEEQSWEERPKGGLLLRLLDQEAVETDSDYLILQNFDLK